MGLGAGLGAGPGARLGRSSIMMMSEEGEIGERSSESPEELTHPYHTRPVQQLSQPLASAPVPSLGHVHLLTSSLIRNGSGQSCPRIRRILNPLQWHYPRITHDSHWKGSLPLALPSHILQVSTLQEFSTVLAFRPSMVSTSGLNPPPQTLCVN